MEKRNNLTKAVQLGFVSIAMILVGFTTLTASTTTNKNSSTTEAASSDISLEPYCKEGYYQIPGEKQCSRAPNCGGYGYDELNTEGKMPNPQSCMGQTVPGNPNSSGCEGYVPVCCYEVARTGDFTKCIGYWERLWCAPTLCNQARDRGANDGQCGGDCQCAHAFNAYCGDKPPVPLSQRLGVQTPPTSTPPPQPTNPIPTTTPGSNNPSSPTWTPAPTWTPIPTQTPNQPQVIVTSPTIVVFPTNSNQPPIAIPTIEIPQIKSPYEIVKEIVSEKKVIALQENTEKPLTVVKKSATTIKTADQKLEVTINKFLLNIFDRLKKLVDTN